MKTIRTLAIAIAVLALPGVAQAHTGFHVLGGADAGFAHPFSGLDHLLTMVAVGLWAASLGGSARLLVPAAFVGVMAAGAALGAAGVTLPAVETAIAASVIAVGVLVAAAVRVPVGVAMTIVAVFALFHGHAHGSEMPAMASPLAYGLGFVAATAILHGVGFILGATREYRMAPVLARAAGGAIAVTGVALAWPL